MNTISKLKYVFSHMPNLDGRNPEIIIYGYTDLMLSRNEWLEHIEEDDYARLDNRPNHENLKKIHGRPEVEKVPTWKSVQNIVFKNKINFTFIDFEKYEGSEIILDLNYIVPDHLIEKYDAVLDLGTSEHVFNYPQVLINSHLLVRPGGMIYHDVPLNWPNHGFYNISPTLFYDFYSDNKAVPIECFANLFDRNGQALKILTIKSIPMWERFSLSSIQGREINICFLIRKIEKTNNFIFPTQRKYRSKHLWE